MTRTRRTVATWCAALLLTALVWAVLAPMASLALAKVTGTDVTPDSTTAVYVLPTTDTH